MCRTRVCARAVPDLSKGRVRSAGIFAAQSIKTRMYHKDWENMVAFASVSPFWLSFFFFFFSFFLSSGKSGHLFLLAGWREELQQGLWAVPCWAMLTRHHNTTVANALMRLGFLAVHGMLHRVKNLLLVDFAGQATALFKYTCVRSALTMVYFSLSCRRRALVFWPLHSPASWECSLSGCVGRSSRRTACSGTSSPATPSTSTSPGCPTSPSARLTPHSCRCARLDGGDALPRGLLDTRIIVIYTRSTAGPFESLPPTCALRGPQCLFWIPLPRNQKKN